MKRRKPLAGILAVLMLTGVPSCAPAPVPASAMKIQAISPKEKGALEVCLDYGDYTGVLPLQVIVQERRMNDKTYLYADYSDRWKQTVDFRFTDGKCVQTVQTDMDAYDYDMRVLFSGDCTIEKEGIFKMKSPNPHVMITSIGTTADLTQVVPPIESVSEGMWWPEVPYFVIDRTAEAVTYAMSTYNTFFVDVPKGRSILTDRNAFDMDSRVLVTYPTGETLYNGSYNGILTAQRVGDFLYGFHHMENPNETNWENTAFKRPYRQKTVFKNGADRYETTIVPPPPGGWKFPEDYSGYAPGKQDYGLVWDTYFSMITMSWSHFGGDYGIEHMAHEEGAVIWPSLGFHDGNGKVLHHGHRHPSSIVHDGYLYLFYIDVPDLGYGANFRNQGQEPTALPEGCEAGVKMSRAEIREDGTLGPFYNYYRGAFSEKSLPEGYNKDDPAFTAVPGGKSSRVHPDLDENMQRFSVAKVKDTDYFLSIEEKWIYQNDTMVGAKFFIRASRDLINWGPGAEITDVGQYPIFANADYTSNTEIDADDFLIAVSNSGTPRVKRVAVEIT